MYTPVKHTIFENNSDHFQSIDSNVSNCLKHSKALPLAKHQKKRSEGSQLPHQKRHRKNISYNLSQKIYDIKSIKSRFMEEITRNKDSLTEKIRAQKMSISSEDKIREMQIQMNSQ